MEAALSEINLKDSFEPEALCSHCSLMQVSRLLLELKNGLLFQQDPVHDIWGLPEQLDAILK